jgi:hypothetical protein
MDTGVLFAVFMAFAGGLCLGSCLRNAAWAEKAGGTRMEYRGKLYRIEFDE